jgi:NitT/TauT family transport system substrate-binding protein
MQRGKSSAGHVAMRTGAAVVLLIWFGAALPVVGAAQERAPPPVSVRLGFNANSARNMAEIPNVIAQRKGFFAREGLAVTMVPLMGTTHMVAALDKGDVDATGTALPYMIQAVLKGSDAAAVVGGVANTIYSLIAKADLHTIADLKGKVVALSAPPDTITLSTRMLLAKGG